MKVEPDIALKHAVLSDFIICLEEPYQNELQIAKAHIIEESHPERKRKGGVGGGLTDQKMQKCFSGSACDFNRESCKMDFLHYLSAVLRSLFLFTYRTNNEITMQS